MAVSDLRLLALDVGGSPEARLVGASRSWGPPLLLASREMGTLVLHLRTALLTRRVSGRWVSEGRLQNDLVLGTRPPELWDDECVCCKAARLWSFVPGAAGKPRGGGQGSGRRAGEAEWEAGRAGPSLVTSAKRLQSSGPGTELGGVCCVLWGPGATRSPCLSPRGAELRSPSPPA